MDPFTQKCGTTSRSYVQQLPTDTRRSPEDLPEAMDDRDG